MQQWIKEVGRGKKGSKDLTYEEMREAARLISSGKATDSQISAFLIAERMKGETYSEVLGFIDELKGCSKKLNLPSTISDDLIDFAGPYDGRKGFVTTVPTSLLLAEAGVPVLLHSSDTLPPKHGMTIKDILSELSIQTNATPKQIEDSIMSNQIGFVWTENLCEPLKKIRHIREEIGVRSIINTVEKMLNLGNAKKMMVGVFHKTAVDKLIPIIQQSSYDVGYVVQGEDGSEDLPIHRKSFVYKVTNSHAESFLLNPEQYGLKYEKDDEVLTKQEQATIMKRILNGEQAPELLPLRAKVIYNTAVRYFLFNITPTIEGGIEKATEQLNEGKGISQLNRWQQLLYS
ncbi:anthranilate phosphoribosyltransferase [Cytobacillus sp. IB215665]|uniref:anthranilate phosphoribosyltransferase n=1 Tax=Cytobacillus sp. IB215665 TaxID=3097357 RepID=UPI002A152F8C|nr:anthranilate phosphoribosyltransferase [Cytobacillus sp. IB215665]MDX8364377.1 anthranilate phosphoribosyltransferase [Cytobacillus sp. IB215665]